MVIYMAAEPPSVANSSRVASGIRHLCCRAFRLSANGNGGGNQADTGEIEEKEFDRQRHKAPPFRIGMDRWI